MGAKSAVFQSSGIVPRWYDFMYMIWRIGSKLDDVSKTCGDSLTSAVALDGISLSRGFLITPSGVIPVSTSAEIAEHFRVPSRHYFHGRAHL